MKLKSFTVILLRPDYVADVYGQDTFMQTIVTTNVKRAEMLVQKMAFDFDSECEMGDPVDYHIIAVIAGQHQDIKTKC